MMLLLEFYFKIIQTLTDTQEVYGRCKNSPAKQVQPLPNSDRGMMVVFGQDCIDTNGRLRMAHLMAHGVWDFRVSHHVTLISNN
jgi:hypothetical protein